MTDSILSVGPGEAGRIVNSVKFTEEYRDRIRGLLEGGLDVPSSKPSTATRGFLLQDAYNGNDALMIPISRDTSNIVNAFLISVVGVNAPDSPNTFKLQVTGYSNDISTGQPNDPDTLLSDVIPVICSPNEMLAHLMTISQGITPENTTVGLGNPYYDDDLIDYGDGNIIQPRQAGTDPTTGDPIQYLPASSMLGAWYICFDATVWKRYNNIGLEVVFDEDTHLEGLTDVQVTPIQELLGLETTVVTDTDYRTAQYPWQKGTIASCFDYADIGLGIAKAGYRTIDVQ